MSLSIKAPPQSDLASRLDGALKPGEQLVWCGQPRRLAGKPRHHVQAAGICMLFGGIVSLMSAAHGGELGWMTLTGMLAVSGLSGGAYMAVRLAIRNRTVYGLTADTAIIRPGVPWARTTLIDLPSLPSISLELEREDMGTIRFGQGAGFPPRDPPSFEHIRHARHVFDLARHGDQPTPAAE